MTSKPTLRDRVYAILGEEYEGSRQVCMEGVDKEPIEDAQLSVRERDLRDWGLVYGLAFGILATDKSDAAREKIRDRALDAARAAYRQWAGEIARRPSVSPLVDEAVLAFDDVECELQTLVHVDGQTGVKPLIQSMQTLRDAIGVPARQAVAA
jgi:hypothetical protein